MKRKWKKLKKKKKLKILLFLGEKSTKKEMNRCLMYDKI